MENKGTPESHQKTFKPKKIVVLLQKIQTESKSVFIFPTF